MWGGGNGRGGDKGDKELYHVCKELAGWMVVEEDGRTAVANGGHSRSQSRVPSYRVIFFGRVTHAVP